MPGEPRDEHRDATRRAERANAAVREPKGRELVTDQGW